MGSKSNTGIKFIDKGVDSLVNDVVAPLAKNVEKNAAHSLQAPLRIFKGGDLSGIGGDMLRQAFSTATFYQGNWDDFQGAAASNGANIKTMSDVDLQKAEAKVAADQASELAAINEENLRQRRSTISGMVTAQALAPGRASVLRGSSRGTTNPLLTYI